MYRPNAKTPYAPRSHQSFKAFDGVELAAVLKRLNCFLKLKRRRHQTDEYATGAQGVGNLIQRFPGFGQVQKQPIDCRFVKPFEQILDFQRPVRRRSKKIGDVLCRDRGKVLANLVRNEAALWTDSAQQGDRERPGAD